MHDFLINLVIGIIGGIFSSIIVSRIFLIREEYQEQLEILRITFYHLGVITTFFDVVEIILKNMLDTSLEMQKSPDYIKNHNLKDGDNVIRELKTTILDNSISTICKNKASLILKEKELVDLQNETCEVVKDFKNLESFKFETVDKCKREINSLEKSFESCFRKKTRYFFILIIKDKILIALFCVFLILCLLTAIV